MRAKAKETLSQVELVRRVGEKTGFAQKDVKVVLKALDEVTLEAVKEGRFVKPIASITIEPIRVDERPNPFDKSVIIPAHNSAKIRLSKPFKDEIR